MHMTPALRLHNTTLAQKALAVFTGTALLTVSSYIEVPMVPVPMTLQTLAVGLIGAIYGWRLGALTVMFWLAEALTGLPVLAGNHVAGPAAFFGPTAGYLAAFPLAAMLTGLCAERGWTSLPAAFLAMLCSHIICLAAGAAWLAHLIGTQEALALGVTPFLLGSLVKSALGAALVKALSR